MNNNAMKDVMTIDELCDYLNISKNTLAKWRRLGLQTVSIDGTTRFLRESVTAFLKRFEA